MENELRIMRAKGLIEDIHASLHNNTGSTTYGGHGGGAMPRLTKMVAEQRRSCTAGKEWDAEDAYELARVIIVNGQFTGASRHPA